MSVEDPFARQSEAVFEEGALSAYLPGGTGQFEARFHSLRFQELVHQERAFVGGPDLTILDREAPRVVEMLEAERPPASSGLAIFAASATGLLEAWRLPEDPESQLRVGRRLQLQPLRRQLALHPPALILLVDKEKANLFLSVLEDVQRIAESTGEPIKQHRQGGWSASNFQHHEDMHTAWNLEAALGWIAKEEWGFVRNLYIGGPPEAVSTLQRLLPAAARKHLVGKLRVPLYATSGQIGEQLRVEIG